MSTVQALTGPIAANNIHKWMRAWHRGAAPDTIDLDLVRQMLGSMVDVNERVQLLFCALQCVLEVEVEKVRDER